ncbi:hypothetical protein KIN20_023388 [Parelaphostrongylus tenuis]|uniref:Uncharacterized protein n=1 Tax=Parelaphostrongylus tenuis TaxID=148309 RepID=A0AAD5MVJ8_PARTN|nr:hypothetical protein KIN20_023388 [Parelaphostrongylus tenuis]
MTFFKVIVGDFKAKIGPRRTSEERHTEAHGLEWNEQDESYELRRIIDEGRRMAMCSIIFDE